MMENIVVRQIAPVPQSQVKPVHYELEVVEELQPSMSEWYSLEPSMPFLGQWPVCPVNQMDYDYEHELDTPEMIEASYQAYADMQYA